MSDQKIIFFGPVGAGKTTAIQSVSEIDCINTDAKASDITTSRKSTTTVAMDYGYITSLFNQRVHLYGTPGQERFEFMWEIISSELAADCSGQILFLDNTRNYPRQDLEFFIQQFRSLRHQKPLIIAVTQSDLSAKPSQADYRSWLAELKLNVPVFFVDARVSDDIKFLIDEILKAPATIAADLAEQPISITEEELSPEQVFNENNHNARFSKALINDLQGLDGIDALALIDSTGGVVESSLNPEQTDLLIDSLPDLTPLLHHAGDFHSIESQVLTSGKTDQFSVFIADYHALVVFNSDQLSNLNLRQQIENILQWNQT